MVDTLTPVERISRDRQPVGRRFPLHRLALQIGWVLGLAAVVVARISRFGFTPADQGFILASSWRLLNGEIPHRDIVSARPLGSAVLHVVDFLSPAPLFVSSVFIAMVEIIVFTIACAALLTRTSPLRWGPLRTLLVASASLINLHLFTLMAWHTIDGLMLSAVGWWLIDTGLRSDSAWQRRIGLFCLGFAVLTKQSFALVAPIGLLMLLLHPAARGQRRSWRRLAVDVLCLGAFPILYVGVVAAAGGLGAAITQFTSARGAFGESLITMWETDFRVLFDLGQVDWRRAVIEVLAVAVLLAVVWPWRHRIGTAGVWLRFVLAGGGAALAIRALVDSELSYPPFWSVQIAWIFVAVIGLDAVVGRHFPWRPLLLVVLAYSASLSWGYDYPALLAGTLVLATLEVLLTAVPEVRVVPRVVTAVVGVVALAAASSALIDVHDRAPAADLPHDRLSVDLGSVAPEMSGIRTSPGVGTYVAQIEDCVRRYPAKKTAVLPDNSFVYPVMKLRNPFPMDWPLPLELVADSRQRMLAAADELNRDGGYLVLFQTVGVGQMRAGEPVPDSVPVDHPVAAGSDPVITQVRDRLTGVPVTCGSFVGVWSR
nr:hypothetical protein [Kibdelosporangium sp. MJ126-NF4]CEL16216.1 hypothetical protein [Kibdelosporangium sp. MJ126-NF4]CTQ94141.1 hypothetical protein [Kibdelosporangium sp. MJ126-NF4]